MTYRLGPWNLSGVVKESELERRIKDVRAEAKSFARIKNRLKPRISSKDFIRIIKRLERLDEKASVVGGYASLLYAADTQSDTATALMMRMNKLGAEISNMTLFFDLWWKRGIDKSNADRLIKDAGQLQNHLKHQRTIAKYSLAESEEKIINTLDVTGATALVKLYDKITGAFEYTVTVSGRKKTMTREELTNLVRSPRAATRKAAYTTLFGRYSKERGVLAEIYQNIVQNWYDEGIKIRGYASPISIRNTANDIDDRTVSVLLDVCQKNAPVFGAFFRQKAKMLGVRKLRRYDMYAPLPRSDQKRYPYDKSVRLVLESLAGFSPTLAGYAKRVFDENHVDSAVRKGKRDGAFCSTLAPNITPFVLINFTQKGRDLFTLAHELGHAVHSIAASDKSILVHDAPLPLAETASTFSEMLMYEKISEDLDAEQKKTVLAEKLDDLYATVGRQSYFTLWEVQAHKKITGGATADDLSDLYLANLQDQFGSAVDVSKDFAVEWSCIPHFYHAPFYCYAYAFGNLLALSLFSRYKKEGSGFARTYIDILAAGGSQKPRDLLLSHGLDISSPSFWQDGFDYIAEQQKMLSKL